MTGRPPIKRCQLSSEILVEEGKIDEPLDLSTTQQSQETKQSPSTLQSYLKEILMMMMMIGGANNNCEEKGPQDLHSTIFLRLFYCKFQNAVFN